MLVISFFFFFLKKLKVGYFIITFAEACSYQHCDIGSTFIPKLQGKFLATENFFHTSKVLFVLYGLLVNMLNFI